MPKFIITERLIVHKYYEVDAESTDEARDALFSYEAAYTVLDSDVKDAEIIDIEEQSK